MFTSSSVDRSVEFTHISVQLNADMLILVDSKLTIFTLGIEGAPLVYF